MNGVSCPKCGSSQLTANKRGYSVSKGLKGLLIPGGVLWGFHGSRKIDITCLACGHKFKPGEGLAIKTNASNDIIKQSNFNKSDQMTLSQSVIYLLKVFGVIAIVIWLIVQMCSKK